MDGGVVFVHDDDRRDLIMLVEQFRKQCKRCLDLRSVRFAVQDRLQVFFVVTVQLGALQQFQVTFKLMLKEISDVGVCVFPRQAFHVLERNEDHGILPLIVLIFLPAFPDVAVPEVYGGVLVAEFKERAEHVHVERLAESPRTSEKRDQRTFVQNVPDQQGFVDVIVFRGGKAIIRDANGNRKPGLNVMILVCSSSDTTVDGFFRVGRYLPGASLLHSSSNHSIIAEFAHAPFRQIPAFRHRASRFHFLHSHLRLSGF